MPADLWLVVGFLGVVAAASLFVYGVWKLDLRLLAIGAVLGGTVWLAIAFTSAGERSTVKLVTLNLRPVDAVRGEIVAGAVVKAVDRETGRVCRLPATPATRREGTAPCLAVTLVVELRLTGSLAEQHDQPAAHTQVIEEALEIAAPGYRTWRSRLTELLPKGWPATPVDSPVVVELRPE